ncbi:MAG: 1,6-anhydro-N-acetylmuramyl-L-alanine amidase AmpD [Gammaproteobacteria bacterium]
MRATIDDAGEWVLEARRVPSPNHDDRPPDTAIDLLVIHAISLPPGRYGGGFVERLFCNTLDCAAHPYFESLRGLRVSAHLLIDRAGALAQFVPLRARAWHAGASSFAGRTACNDFSIGVELEGIDTDGYTEAQYLRLAAVARAAAARWPAITPGRVVGHSDIAPGRKTDPGPHFDWARLRADLALP